MSSADHCNSPEARDTSEEVLRNSSYTTSERALIHDDNVTKEVLIHEQNISQDNFIMDHTKEVLFHDPITTKETMIHATVLTKDEPIHDSDNSIQKAFLHQDPNVGSTAAGQSTSCLQQRVPLEPLDQVDGHTLSSVSLASVGCPDPGLLSNMFQEPNPCPVRHSTPCPDTNHHLLPPPLQDTIDISASYAVYNTQFSLSTQQFVPELASVVTVPDLSYPLTNQAQETVTLTISDTELAGEVNIQAQDYRLDVLARTWTLDLPDMLAMGLWSDTDIYCAGGEQVSCHGLLLAAASPFLFSCLSSALASSPGQERNCLIFPDFNLVEIEEFINLVYLKDQIVDEDSSACRLMSFLTQSIFFYSNGSDDSIKNEEKGTKTTVEVKMEESLENKSDAKNEVHDGKHFPSAKGSHTCDLCGKNFKLGRILKEHMGLHKEPRFKCEIEGCTRKFHLKANLKAHVDVVHLKTKDIPCNICGKLFYNQTHLRSHMEHHNNDKHVCEHCSRYFSCSKSLRDHIKFKHSDPNKLPTCSVCQKSYSTPQNLKSHFARVHMQEKKYICSECGRSFFEKNELDIHLSSHNPKDQNVECDICKLMFKNSKTLYYHKKRSHDPNNKIHICYQCGKSYTDSHHLTRHIESHGQKLSLCKICGKAFQSEQKVKAHVRKVHEKWRKSEESEKPCVMCDKKFTNFGSLKRHLKDVHKLSLVEVNTMLIDRFRLDPKKHRMNPAEILSKGNGDG